MIKKRDCIQINLRPGEREVIEKEALEKKMNISDAVRLHFGLQPLHRHSTKPKVATA